MGPRAASNKVHPCTGTIDLVANIPQARIWIADVQLVITKLSSKLVGHVGSKTRRSCSGTTNEIVDQPFKGTLPKHGLIDPLHPGTPRHTRCQKCEGNTRRDCNYHGDESPFEFSTHNLNSSESFQNSKRVQNGHPLVVPPRA